MSNLSATSFIVINVTPLLSILYTLEFTQSQGGKDIFFDFSRKNMPYHDTFPFGAAARHSFAA